MLRRIVGQCCFALSCKQARRHLVQSRGLLQNAREPSLTSEAVERPHTIVLSQDLGFNTSPNWFSEDITRSIVDDHGFSFASLETSSSSTDVNSALQEMAGDLSTVPSAILVARGPVVSWISQLYLESYSLSGLVLIDPVLLDDSVKTTRLVEANLDRNTRSAEIFHDYCNHWDHWSLRLEPGSVPMMVVSTRSTFADASRIAAERHSTNGKVVPFISAPDEGDVVSIDLLERVIAWIDEEGMDTVRRAKPI